MPATDEFFRDVKKTHVVFAFSAAALFVATIWMMAADHVEEWRGYQQTMDKLQKGRLQAKELAYKTEQFQTPEEWQARVQELTQTIAAKQAELDAETSHVPDLRRELAKLDQQIDLKSRAVRDERALRDVARANYDLGIRDARPPAVLEALKAEFDRLQAAVNQHERELEDLEVQRAALAADLSRATAELARLEAELAELRGKVDQARAALAKLDPRAAAGPGNIAAALSAAKRAVMDWPIIDGFNSPHKVVNDWLPDLQITLGMTRTARFDRCRTCHQGIDRMEAGNVPAFPLGDPRSDSPSDWLAQNQFPHPFATHPRPDVYVTSSSPHPAMEGSLKFGCTVCHDGNGSGTSFQNAEHGPNDPHQAEQWARRHHYHANHFWEYPMRPRRFIESGCIKCHHKVVELGVHPKYGATAPKVYRGFQLVQQYGCFGCHEIHGYDAGRPIGPDLRLEPQTREEAEKIAADPSLVAGQMRKVGPSLAHIGSKTTPGWIEFWTAEPRRFRPSTRMPQFFHLTPKTHAESPDVADRFEPVEVAALAHFLVSKSRPLDLLQPADGYQPDAERGKTLFADRGCLACHTHKEFPQVSADFAPDLSQVHAKIRPGAEGFRWVYTWVRDPEQHHPRTRMPNLYLEAYEQAGEWIDPAADIAAFLLKDGPREYAALPFAPGSDDSPQRARQAAENQAALDDLLRVFLIGKALTRKQTEEMLATRRVPLAAESIKGDEIELVLDPETGQVLEGTPTAEQWLRMKLNYVGRRSVSFYGCYGCHDIPGFETARPIGTTLQDWGRKDTSRLAFEHIEEYLHHHGEPDGSSTASRVAAAVRKMQGGGAAAGEFASLKEQERELSAAYFYDSLLHHGRPGFIWQKLRQPRSYDYEKLGTKGYDERLRMPRFPLREDEIEAIATFVLGLVAEPPASQYLYRPGGPAGDRIEGERLLEKYNCAGCHMLEMPEIRFAADPGELPSSSLKEDEHAAGLELLLKLKPPREAFTGQSQTVTVDGQSRSLPVVSFRGLIYRRPDPQDPPEDQEFNYDLWETLSVGQTQIWPSTRLNVGALRLPESARSHPSGYFRPPRGGEFAEFLVEQLLATHRADDPQLAWQMAPPPLYREGDKVQTPWLYHFLKEPARLRQVTVLRMPRFNMSDEELRALANYFAANDGADYPYQDIPQREPAYAERLAGQTGHSGGEAYLSDAWKLVNGPVCIGCHSVGGRKFQKSADPKQVQGPNLDFTATRLRPDWTLLWLYKPKWITPYTSMPPPYPRNQQQFPEVFGGDPGLQAVATRDALMNYHQLMEREGHIVFTPKGTEKPPGGGGGQ